MAQACRPSLLTAALSFPPCWFSLPPGCHPESIVSIPFGCLCLASSFLPGFLTFPSLLFFPFPGCMMIRESCLSTICLLQSRNLMRGAVYSMPCSVHLGVQQMVAELGRQYDQEHQRPQLWVVLGTERILRQKNM